MVFERLDGHTHQVENVISNNLINVCNHFVDKVAVYIFLCRFPASLFYVMHFDIV